MSEAVRFAIAAACMAGEFETARDIIHTSRVCIMCFGDQPIAHAVNCCFGSGGATAEGLRFTVEICYGCNEVMQTATSRYSTIDEKHRIYAEITKLQLSKAMRRLQREALSAPTEPDAFDPFGLAPFAVQNACSNPCSEILLPMKRRR